MKPLIKYPGGKASIAAAIAERIPYFTGRYAEPCFGGGGVFFHLSPPKGAWLSDASENLIAMYRSVKVCPYEVWYQLERIIKNYTEAIHKAEIYYAARNEFNNAPQRWGSIQAARFLFLNKAGYNGLVRVNGGGDANVPHGKYASPSFPTQEQVVAASLALQGASLACCDFEETLRMLRPDDFAYIDPPYHQSYDQYTPERFGESDQVRLATAVREATERGVKCLVSNSNTNLIRDLYSDYKIEIIDSQHRRINSKADGRKATTELLISCWEKGE